MIRIISVGPFWGNGLQSARLIQIDVGSPVGKIPPTQYKRVPDPVVRGLSALDR